MNYISLFFIVMLTACGTSSPKQENTALLEKPPGLLESKPENQEAIQQDKAQNSQTNQPGNSHSPLLIEGFSDTEFIVKRSFDESWGLLGKAIKIAELNIVKRSRSGGTYHVEYTASSGGLLSSLKFLGNASSVYLVKLEGKGEVTRVTASLSEDEENFDSGSLKDGSPDYVTDNSDKLSKLLVDSLQNDF